MKRLMIALLAAVLLLGTVCMAESLENVETAAEEALETDAQEGEAALPDLLAQPDLSAQTGEAGLTVPDLTDDDTSIAADGSRELSGFFGGDIAQAASEIGGLTFEAGEEYAENYAGDDIALRGNGGVVTLIDLRPENGNDTLCGIRNGMTREDAEVLMNGCPMMWRYDEEIAWLIRADAEDELKDEILVVFFDEDSKVAGAWYRVAGM